MTPEQEISRRKKLVSAAKALLSLQVGLAVGAARIENILSWLGETYQREHPLFAFFIANIPPEIPLGGARLLWRSDLMLETDDRLARIEAKFRRALLGECVKIIDRYDPTSKVE
ncbi:hypothetical protein [Dyella sp. 2HG41-7]|uniref:hypothetical protein n=1 Tax=Dyella sp. 2HG41-7 TaxID=2883239 RepID=UPI001F4784E8|nr:hypothetical protein [Dyella sp. 2HG41-7]